MPPPVVASQLVCYRVTHTAALCTLGCQSAADHAPDQCKQHDAFTSDVGSLYMFSTHGSLWWQRECPRAVVAFMCGINIIPRQSERPLRSGPEFSTQYPVCLLPQCLFIFCGTAGLASKVDLANQRQLWLHIVQAAHTRLKYSGTGPPVTWYLPVPPRRFRVCLGVNDYANPTVSVTGRARTNQRAGREPRWSRGGGSLNNF